MEMVFREAQARLGMACGKVPSRVLTWPWAQLPAQLLWADRAVVGVGLVPTPPPQRPEEPKEKLQGWAERPESRVVEES